MFLLRLSNLPSITSWQEIASRFSASHVWNSSIPCWRSAVIWSGALLQLLDFGRLLVHMVFSKACPTPEARKSCSQSCGFSIRSDLWVFQLERHEAFAHCSVTHQSDAAECFKYPHHLNELSEKYTHIRFQGPESREVHPDMSAYRKNLGLHQVQCELCLNSWSPESESCHHSHKSVAQLVHSQRFDISNQMRTCSVCFCMRCFVLQFLLRRG